MVVVGALTRFDDIAATMVAQALRAEGAEALELSRRSALPASLTKDLGGFQPESLVLVSLNPEPGPSIDLQVRQLRRRLPGVQIGMAIWTRAEGSNFPKVSADFVATGMEEVLAMAFATAPPSTSQEVS